MTTINTDESQNIEFKESWNDKYLQWICGFANAQGGRIYIGVNDNREVVGVDNPKKLMEDIPNKVRDVMGIIVEVNRLEADGLAYVEVVVEAYPYPISYRGHYYQRSGATNQELKGSALDRFMLRRQGKTWDGVPTHSSVPAKWKRGVEALSASSKAVMKTVSQRWISAMMPADFGQHSGISILPG